MKVQEDKGWTITFYPWESGLIRVAGRFKTTEEKDAFLNEIRKPDSGWLEEELMSIRVINDYNYSIFK